MLEHGTTVLLLAHSQYLGVYTGIAKKLRQELDAKVHLYTSTIQEADYYRDRHGDTFASITVADALYAACREPVGDEAAVIDTARRNEAELGVSINQLAVSDRHLGRGYALGGFKHPRSRISEETSYIQMLNGYNTVIDFWRRELDEKRPALLLNASKVLCVLARMRDIPVRILTGSRYKNYYYWAVNEFLETGDSLKNRMAVATVTDLPFDEPVADYTAFRKKFDSEKGFLRTARKTAYMVLRQVYWRLRGFEKARGYYLTENIRYLWRKYRDAARMTDPNLPVLDDLKGTPFVFFTLATEPETALQQLSPEYLSQLSCIQGICRCLPADYTLVVKEHHTALGRRPTDFYRQIAEFKNATFMNMSEPGFNVVKEAAAVVTITGTAGFEAAVMGKPAIVFGRYVIYQELSHVLQIRDEGALAEALDAALNQPWDQAPRNGKRFLAALVDFSFDLGSYSQWTPKVVEQDTIDRALDNLTENLSALPSHLTAAPRR